NVVFAERAVLATGQRGCTVLLYNNEKYVRNRRSSTRTYWICSRKDITVCRARIVTTRDDRGNEIIVQRSFEHNHTRKFPVRKSNKTNKLNEIQTLLNSPNKKLSVAKIEDIKPPPIVID
ncbi:uncharacterized protein, partial [Musca autumnalis]|uniref:uncharacterized protein n=1 Tax=Musca autumnalis TaxID=221902 RepID=UPI003CE8874E